MCTDHSTAFDITSQSGGLPAMTLRGLTLAVACASASALPLSATAGAKLKIDDESSIDLGFRVQAMYLNNDKDYRSNKDEFRLRRARFRLKGDITKWVTAFLQTEAGLDEGGTGEDMRLIDAWAMVKPHELLNITAGLHMPATTRENLTSSGALLAIDRPGINNKLMGWGNSGRAAFNTGSLGGTGGGLGGDGNVRDRGVSLFGKSSFDAGTHFKYYLGVFEGSTYRQSDSERLAGRVQVNFFDPEPGYFQAATYLGKKMTVAIGLGFDKQNSVASDSVTGEAVDYRLWSLDGFAELPVARGSLTAEGAFTTLKLDGPGNVMAASPSGSTLGVAARQVAGKGYYVQLGYYQNKWQPWVAFESWNADSVGSEGDWDAWKGGVSYYIKGHNAAIKVGYESVDNKTSGQVGADTFAIGLYTTY